jgi:hypothetical protein
VKARDGFVPLAGAGGWVVGLGRRLGGRERVGVWVLGRRFSGREREKAGDGCSIHGWVGEGIGGRSAVW